MKHRKVYNEFQINLILFAITCIMLIPIVSVVSYIFDLQEYTSTSTILLVASALLIIFFVIGIIYILITKDKYKRRLKPSYQREFTTILVVCGFGILGIGIMFIYLGGPAFYVPHVIVPLFIGIYSFIFLIGDIYFNVRYIRK